MLLFYLLNLIKLQFHIVIQKYTNFKETVIVIF